MTFPDPASGGPHPQPATTPAGYPTYPSPPIPPMVRPGAYGSYQAAAGYPPYPPPYSYGFPQDPSDPLVTPIGEGFSGWWRRLRGVATRSWRAILALAAVGWLIPIVVVGLIVFGVFAAAIHDGDPGSGIIGGVVLAVIGVLGWVFLQAAVMIGILWTVTRHANAQPAPLRQALAYGSRRAFPVIGWQLLTGLVVTAGICACVLPGLYFMVATTLVVPIAVFQRGTNPISESFAMVNRNFGAVLGRTALLYAPILAFQFLGQVVQFATMSTDLPDANATAPSAMSLQLPSGFVVYLIVVYLFEIAWQAVMVVGNMLTYAEMRARVSPTTTATLTAELDRY